MNPSSFSDMYASGAEADYSETSSDCSKSTDKKMSPSPARIKVIGVGGAGMNAINRMKRANLQHVEFIAVNTDEQDLVKTLAEKKIGIGKQTTRGMGAGGDPELGERAALEDRERLHVGLRDADMIFITAGMGGGTGTGAAPVIAELAKQMGILTVGVVTLPFTMEGHRRMKIAQIGAARLRSFVDTLITIKNDSVFRVIDSETPVQVAFQRIDDILLHAIGGVSDLINTTGLVNVDFADVSSVMGQTGDAIMGAGEGAGPDRIEKAVDQAIHNALLAEEYSVEGARAVLIHVSGGNDLGITEWKEVTEYVTRLVDKDANIIVGLTLNENLQDRIRVLVIATGFSAKRNPSGIRHTPVPRGANVGDTRGIKVPTRARLTQDNPSLRAQPTSRLLKNMAMQERTELEKGLLFGRSSHRSRNGNGIGTGTGHRNVPPKSRHQMGSQLQEVDRTLEALAKNAKTDGNGRNNMEVPAFLRRQGATPEKKQQ